MERDMKRTIEATSTQDMPLLLKRSRPNDDDAAGLSDSTEEIDNDTEV